MRDYVFMTVLLGSLPFCFARPYIGILMWSWLSYMSPHRLTWSPEVRFFPVAQYVGIATLLGFCFTRKREKLPMEREVVLLLLLWGMYTLTSFFALDSYAWNEWDRTSKILIFTFLTIVLCLDRQKIRHLLLVIVFSIGFYGFKGGIFGLRTQGNHKIFGPEGTFIGDNNALGLALLVILPLLWYMPREEDSKILKMALRVTFFTSLLSTILTYSRGAFLGLAFILFMLLLRSRKKVLAVAMMGVGLFWLATFVPEKWTARMETIKTYEEDGSSMGRINAWYFAWNLALDRPLIGGGFNTFTRELFTIYAPDPTDFHDAHSIYFEVLAEHGFIALGIFLSLLVCSILSMRKLRKSFKDIQSCRWICTYSEMIELSLYAYMVSGAFLGLAYFDLSYHMMSVVIMLKVLARREMEILHNSQVTGGTPTQTAQDQQIAGKTRTPGYAGQT